MIFGLFGSKTPQYQTTDAFDDLLDIGVGGGNNYFQGQELRDYSVDLLDQVNAGTLDPFYARELLDSRIEPGSDFVNKGKYKRLANYQVPDDAQNAIFDSVANTYLGGSDGLATEELRNRLFEQARAMGATGSRRQLNEYLTSEALKQPGADLYTPGMNAFEQQYAAKYGPLARDAQGKRTGGYMVFGDNEEKYAQNDALMASIQQGLRNYTSKMGAYGSLG